VEAHLFMLLADFLRRMARNRRIAGFALAHIFQQQDCRHKRLLGRFPAFGIAVGKDQLFPGSISETRPGYPSADRPPQTRC
jgi:hypothetical protein